MPKRQLSQQLITQSKLLMSARLVQIENQIMRKFQTYKDKELVKKMFYRNLDQLPSMQEKITYLLMVLDDMDSQRVNKYMLSSFKPYQTEPQTDTSLQFIDQQPKPKTNMKQSPTKYQRNTHSLLQSVTNPPNTKNNQQDNQNYNQLKNYINSPSNTIQPLNRSNRLSHNKSQQNLSKYYSQSYVDSSQTDQAIISSLYNSNQPHLYKDLINMHRQRKSQAQISTADSLIQNQKILHQLKKLQMQKKIQKYQKNTLSPKYSQTLTSPSYLQPQINQYPKQTKSCCSDFQQQTDFQSKKNPNTIYNKDLLTKLQKKYQTKQPNYQKQNIYQSKKTEQQKKDYNKKSNQFSGNINDLYSFRPIDNIKKGNINKTITQKQQKVLRQEQKNRLSFEERDQQIQRNQKSSSRKKQYENISKKLNQREDLMNEQDQWLIQRLNKKIHDEDYLNSMVNKKPSRVSSQKQSQFMSSYGQNLAKLHKLQQERFLSDKQAQFKNNPLGQALSDRALKQKLTGFKSWLKNQSITNLSSERNNINEMSNFKRLPKFKFFNTQKDLNQFGDYVDKRYDKGYDKGYVCYSQSQLQSLSELYDKGMRIKQQKESKSKSKERWLNSKMDQKQSNKRQGRDKLFKKKPQLIITQSSKKGNNLIKRSKSKQNNKHKLSCSHSKSLSRSKSRGNHHKISRQKQKLDKMKQIQRIYSPKCVKDNRSKSKGKRENKSNKLQDYLPKHNNQHKDKNKNKLKHNKFNYNSDQQYFDNDTSVDEDKMNYRLLNRVKSSPYMMYQMPFSRQKQDYNQLIERYRLDERRQKEVKNQILQHNQYENNFCSQGNNYNYSPYGTY